MAEPFCRILAVAVFGVSTILLVWGVFRVLPSVSRRVAQSFWCPFRDCNVTAEFREEPWDGARVDVARCTAFTPPDLVRQAVLTTEDASDVERGSLNDDVLLHVSGARDRARSPVASAVLGGGV
jgi:hypothetical protein